MTGLPGCLTRSQSSTSRSAPVSPCCPSTMNNTLSASKMPAAACHSMESGRSFSVSRSGCTLMTSVGRSCARLSRPPVSTTTNSLSPQKARVYMRSRVTPGWSYTIAICLPQMRLNMADLPTLGRPTTATLGSAATGSSFSLMPALRRARMLIGMFFDFVAALSLRPLTISASKPASRPPSSSSSSSSAYSWSSCSSFSTSNRASSSSAARSSPLNSIAASSSTAAKGSGLLRRQIG
mmetsp:Transcript_39653/g.101352  ORF Transcript_39653/g.101352 Transcript_39653/m.101352 type:complete len:237 (+) Transcript_39653:1215-1925(+)